MVILRRLEFWLTLLVCLMATGAAMPVRGADLPSTPGFHDLYYTGQLAGQTRRMAYDIFLPKGYEAGGKWPMLVYLIGVGDRGDNHRALFNNGPLPYLRTDKALGDWAPFIVFTPQCPADLRWDSPGMTEYLVEMIAWARRSWPVDPDRVCLTGLSMGGTATWRVALQAGGTFSVIAPLCAPEVEPERMPAAVKGATVCIICGGADGANTVGSRKMEKALREGQADVLYVEVPGKGHLVWPEFYASRRFYEFLLMHWRGEAPPVHRPGAEQLLAISYTPMNSADAELAEPLRKFLPWWFLSNCGRENSPGLKDQTLGRNNVFVTTPLGRDVPCRMMYTVAVGKQKKTVLKLVVAAHPQGQWELAVVAENRELLKRIIGGGDAKDRWVELTVDLSEFAGQRVHLELLNQYSSPSHSEAYWGEVDIVAK